MFLAPKAVPDWMSSSDVPLGKVVSKAGMCSRDTPQTRYSALNQKQPRSRQQQQLSKQPQQSPQQPQQSPLQPQQQSSPRIGPLNKLVDPPPSVGEEFEISLGLTGITSVFGLSLPKMVVLSGGNGGRQVT